MFEIFSRGNSGNEGMDRKTVTSEHANIKTVESQGVLTEQAELAKEPETKGDTVELGKFRGDKSLLSDNHPDTLDISEAQARESSLFTTEECEMLEKVDSGLSDEELSSVEKVEKALDDPEYPNDRTNLYYQLCQEEGKFVRDVPDYDDPQDRIREELSDRAWVEDQPSEKPISELSAGAFKELIQEATDESDTENEELSEPEEREEESEVDVVHINSETAELAADSFESRGKYWSDFAEDLEASSEVPDTEVTTRQEHTRIRTKHEPLQVELMEMHHSPDYNTRVRWDSDAQETLIAKVPEGERY